MLVYDMNTYLQSDTTLKTLTGKDPLFIEPATGYSEEVPPVILWWYYPGIATRDIPGWRLDRVVYMILDSDSNRCLSVGERIVSLLDKQRIMPAIASSANTAKSCLLVYGNFEGPAIREGWYRYKIEFQVSWVPNS